MVSQRNSYRYVFIHKLVYPHIFPCSVKSDHLGARTAQCEQPHLVPQSWLLILFCNKGPRLFGETVGPRTRARNIQDKLENLVVPGSKKESNNNKIINLI